MEDNIVKVGSKFAISYSLAVAKKVELGMEEVILKARGQHIQKAVDASQICVNRFLPNYEVKKVNIGTDKLKMNAVQDGKEILRNVSWIEITIVKKINTGMKDGLK